MLSTRRLVLSLSLSLSRGCNVPARYSSPHKLLVFLPVVPFFTPRTNERTNERQASKQQASYTEGFRGWNLSPPRCGPSHGADIEAEGKPCSNRRPSEAPDRPSKRAFCLRQGVEPKTCEKKLLLWEHRHRRGARRTEAPAPMRCIRMTLSRRAFRVADPGFAPKRQKTRPLYEAFPKQSDPDYWNREGGSFRDENPDSEAPQQVLCVETCTSFKQRRRQTLRGRREDDATALR